MSETEILVGLILLAVCAGCLLLVLVAVVSNGHSLRRIERSLKTSDVTTKSVKSAKYAAAAAVGRSGAARGDFETFLGEDPARLLLPKSEQFKGYRRWRQDKGLNWSKP
ncbi:MAG: hypothetical protein WCP35_08300 [Verrucomicrobiota bacterium]